MNAHTRAAPFGDMALDQLGSQAHAHYTAGKRSLDKAEEHAKSAGLYLVEAKARVAKRKDMTWPQFLKAHCDIGRSRADELIMIADGRKTEEQHREGRKKRNDGFTGRNRERRAVLDGKSLQITQQKQEGDVQPPPTDPERETVMARIITKLERLPVDRLRSIERTIP